MVEQKIKQGYTQTELGIIPEDWIIGKLEDYLSFISYGFTNPMPITKHGIFLITATDINEGELQFETARHTKKEAYDNLTAKSKPKQNDILLTKDGTLGRLALVGNEKICINQSVAIIRPNSKVVPLFLKYLLESPYYQRKMIRDAGGSTIKHIYITIVNLMKIALPQEKDEQIKITDSIHNVIQLIRKYEKFIEKKKNIKKGMMQELLTGKRRLEGFNGNWEVKTLEEITNCLDSVRIPLNDAQRKKMRGDIPYCGANRVVDYVNDYVIDDDFILIAEDGGHFDEYESRSIAYKMSGKCWVNNHAHILKSKEGFNQDFIFYSLVHKNILRFLSGGTRAKLTKSEMYKIQINIPIDPEEQSDIVQIISDMYYEINQLKRERDKYIMIKQGMIQKLLTGEIRLK